MPKVHNTVSLWGVRKNAHRTIVHQTADHRTIVHQTVHHRTIVHQTEDHRTKEHQTVDHRTIVHQTVDRNSLVHQTEDYRYNAPDHNSQDNSTPIGEITGQWYIRQ